MVTVFFASDRSIQYVSLFRAEHGRKPQQPDTSG